ncbi:MAG: SCO family protein [Planctomycetota bacterium]|nr:SCO family protein [Planctomycetota bacterium]
MNSIRFTAVALTFALAMSLSAPLSAQVADWQSRDMDGVGVEEQLGAEVPLDLEFKNSKGETVRLGDMFDGERPTVLTMNYANCPQLCGLQINGFVKSLNEMKQWSVGDQFQVVTVSLDPTESDDLAAGFRAKTLAGYDRPQAEQGWSFLRGKNEDIRLLADTVGFHYNSFEDKGQYAHTAVLILLDPQGKVARYLYGIEYLPSTLRLSLAETASSKYVSTVDALILRCFLYDAASGTFVGDAWKITKIVMTLVAVILFAFIGRLVLLERKVRKKTAA